MTASQDAHHNDHPTHALFGVDDAPPPRTLTDILHTTANTHPTATALVGSDGELTYRELISQINRQHSALAEAGVGHGDRIGIRVPSGTTDL